MSASLWEVVDSSGVVGVFPTRRLAEIYAERHNAQSAAPVSVRRESHVTLRRKSHVILRRIRSKEVEPGK